MSDTRPAPGDVPPAPTPPTPTLSMRQVLACGALVVALSMGIRHGFGLWLQPVTMDRGWTREAFAFALAVQNLAWGLAGPLAGMIADRFGAFRVLVAGALLYAGGLVVMGLAATPAGFLGGAGLAVGLAQSGTTYAVVYGVIGRQVAPARRSWAMGVAAAAGSFGQFLMVPVENALIDQLGWQAALFALGAAALAIVPLAFGLREPEPAPTPAEGHAPAHAHTRPHPHATHACDGAPQAILPALREAFGCPSFLLLMAGYFVCGFQLAFIGVHIPGVLRDHGLSPSVASSALALIGLFNVFGSYASGSLGQRLQKRHLLSAIYASRAAAIALFLAVPVTPLSVDVFAAVMGLLWLSTVPPTNAVLAQIFGVRHMSMLGGFVFLSHQVGAFLGVWLGGALRDATGSYDAAWYLAIGLGLFAALVNLPVREDPIARATPA